MLGTRFRNIRRFYGDWHRFRKRYKIHKEQNIRSDRRWINNELDVLMGSDEACLHEFARDIKKKKSFKINPSSIGRIFYNLAKVDSKNMLFETSVMNELEQWKNQFPHRVAFGFLYGTLRLSSEKNLIYFARNELENSYNINSQMDEIPNYGNALRRA